MQNTFQLPWSRSQEATKRKSRQCQDRPESWKSERKRCYDPGTQEWEQHSLLPWEEWRLPPFQEWKTWLLVFFVSSVWMALSLPSFFLNYFGFDTNLYIAVFLLTTLDWIFARWKFPHWESQRQGELDLRVIEGLLGVVTEAHKLKLDTTKLAYNCNSSPRASPFSLQHPSNPLSETKDE